MKIKLLLMATVLPLTSMSVYADDARPMLGNDSNVVTENEASVVAKSMIVDNTKAVSMLNELLKGEISAVETYRQVLTKLGTEPGADKLREYAKSHASAVDILKNMINDRSGSAVTTSGSWGTWAEAVVGSAKILGDKTALMALREGEEHGVKEYEEALENPYLSKSERETISNQLLKNQKEHILSLQSMIDTL